jgi:hypothetical protein
MPAAFSRAKSRPIAVTLGSEILVQHAALWVARKLGFQAVEEKHFVKARVL